MPQVPSSQPLLPSLLDRLLDEQPTETRETPQTRSQVLRQLKQSLRRDLENLLNTRRMCATWPENLSQLEFSLVSYGLPDISGAKLGSAQNRQEFQEIVERVIRHFEPRFKSVSVEMLEQAEPLDRILRFRIDALLYAEPAPEPVIFDSALEPVTGSVKVKGASP
jgi:type VI secretion system protein ImpF